MQSPFFLCGLIDRVSIWGGLGACLLSILIVNNTTLPSQKWTGLGDKWHSYLFIDLWSVKTEWAISGARVFSTGTTCLRSHLLPLLPLCGQRGRGSTYRHQSSNSYSHHDFSPWPLPTSCLRLREDSGVLWHLESVPHFHLEPRPYCHSHLSFHMYIGISKSVATNELHL